jgi:ADP-heptose:LPS heptosyltransferase
LKILLIRLRLIGDVVLTTPAIRAIRQAFPDAQITYVVERYAAPIVQDNPHLDRVLVIPPATGWPRLMQDFTLAQQLRHERFDLVVDFHGGPRGSWLAWASGAPVRVGYAVKGRSWMYTVVVPRPRELRSRHSVENQWDLLPWVAPALARAPDPTQDRVEMREAPAASATLTRRLAALGIAAGHRLIVIHVSAGNPFRRWPAEAFVELVARLGAAGQDRRIILTSGPSETDAAKRISSAARVLLGTGPDVTVIAGEDFTLPELRSLIGRAALFIGGDTGPLHVAATTDVPILGIYGPTLPVRSAPWRPPWLVTESVEVPEVPCRPCDQRRCIPGDFRCLTRLAPDVVIQAAERALRRAQAAPLTPDQCT